MSIKRPTERRYGIALVAAWMDVMLSRDATWADALEDLNAGTGRTYNRGRVYQWLTGERAPGPDAIAYMVGIVSEAELTEVLRDLADIDAPIFENGQLSRRWKNRIARGRARLTPRLPKNGPR